MVWVINRRREYGSKSIDDRLYQKTNMLVNIHSAEYTSFDFYYLWHVGVGIINIDMTEHNEEFYKDITTKISEARNYNHLGPYRPIGVAVTVSVKNTVEIIGDVKIKCSLHLRGQVLVLSGYGAFPFNHFVSSVTNDSCFALEICSVNIYSAEYTSFDFYYLWHVGVGIINIDMTEHNEEFYKDITTKISEARNYNHLGPYRPIGVAVTVSVKNTVEIIGDVDVIIVKGVLNKNDFLNFRRRHSKFNVLILLWISSYNLNDLYFLIKVSDGVVLDIRDPKKAVQKYYMVLFKNCREMHKPIILFRPAPIAEYLGQPRVLLSIAKELVDFNLDGVLLEDCRNAALVVDGTYDLAYAMAFIEKEKQSSEHCDDYFKMRSELKLPVLPPLSVAHSASLAALNCGAPLIVVLTRSGRSARWISCARPPCHIMAITTQASTARHLHVYKQLMPVVYEQPSAPTWQEEFWNRIHFGITFAIKIGLLSHGAKFVVLSQHGYDGYCNSIQILTAPKQHDFT